jgi:hypothetical protein
MTVEQIHKIVNDAVLDVSGLTELEAIAATLENAQKKIVTQRAALIAEQEQQRKKEVESLVLMVKTRIATEPAQAIRQEIIKYRPGLLADAVIELVESLAEIDPVDPPDSSDAYMQEYLLKFPEFKRANVYKYGPLAPIYRVYAGFEDTDINDLRDEIYDLTRWCTNAFLNSSVPFFSGLPVPVIRDCSAQMAADFLEGLTLASGRTLRAAHGQDGYRHTSTGAFLAAVHRSYDVDGWPSRLCLQIPSMKSYGGWR